MRSCMCDGGVFVPARCFCGGPMLFCVRYSCSLKGFCFCVAFLVLVLLRVSLDLVSGETLVLVLSAEVAAQVLESCREIAHGQFSY